ncbi:helix-turn-helix transcriptional regulator [Streptomyces lavendulae]|uniref:helix-turn-helix transcriptional regulator n=1 Tax=Streptomyces lavendulae TaxID=1914 RepID=UPI0036E39C9B
MVLDVFVTHGRQGGFISFFRLKDSRLSSIDPLSSVSAATFRHRPAIGRAFLGVHDAAEYLGISPKTLYVWRHRRQGPPSFRMGARGRVTYRIDALDAWIREQEQADSRSNPALNPVSTAPQRRAAYPATV